MTVFIKACLLLSLFLLSSCAHTAGKSPTTDLAYRIEPTTIAGKPAFHIKVTFAGDADGETDVLLPSEWAGEKNYDKAILNLKASQSDVELMTTKSSELRLVRHKPSQVIELSYDLVQDWTGETVVYRPIFSETYFHIMGYALFVHPDWNENRNLKIGIEWKKFPSDWKIANSHATHQRLQSMEISLRELRHSIYVGGDFRIQTISIEGKPLVVAVNGKFGFTDTELFSHLEKVVKSGRDFWNDHDFPYFLVTVIRTNAPCCSFGGTGLTNSFATFLATDAGIEDDSFKHLYTHELFHTWNGRKIERQSPEQLVYWFSEGFTDYYTRLLNLRSGIIQLPEYIETYNAVIFKYLSSPERNASNERILADYWNNYDIEKLPYQRGDILAHQWNAKIKKESHSKKSIDFLMKDLFAEAQSSKKTVVSAANISRLIKPYLPEGIDDDLKNYIEAGKTLSLDSAALGPCVSLSEINLGEFYPGFDSKKTRQSGRIVGVDKTSNAYKAGVRDGQWVLDRKAYSSKPWIPVKLKLKDESGERWIEYIAQNRKISKYPRYVLNSEMFKNQKKKCLDWFL